MDDESESVETLWGENNEVNPVYASVWSKDILNNMEQDVIINSVKPVHFKTVFCNREPKIPQTEKERSIVLKDKVKQTVKLIKYKYHLKEIVEKGRLQRDPHDVNIPLRMPSVSTESTEDVNPREKKIIFYKDERSDFTNGVYEEPPLNITEESALNILRSCVSNILTFVGFTETTIVPLQMLTEAAENYIQKMVKLLHVNVEKEKLEGELGFCDALDRTCHEMSIGSIQNLAHYYKHFLKINSKKISECKEEIRVYERLVKKLREEKRGFSDLSSAELDVNVIPELHLTSMNSSNILTESFEAGLQMLQTLERHQMKNLNVTENSNGSASISSIGTSDYDEPKPFKRKRK